MLLATPVLGHESAQFLLLGMATGALIGLVSLSVVLVYRASGVLNFASGAVGGIGAFVCYSLRDQHGWPAGFAVVAGLAVGAGLGALSHLVVMILARGSLIVRLVAMLAALSAAQGFMTIEWGTAVTQPKSFLPTRTVHVFGSELTIGLDRLLLIGLAVVLAGLLRLAYSRTLFGLATAAVAENRQVAAGAGWSPNVVSLANFVVAGLLSALAAILLAPIVTLNAAVLSVVVLPALAAALVGRFSSFGITLAAALVIGIAQTELSLFQPDLANAFGVSAASLTGLSQAVPLVVILGYAIISGRARPGRGEVSARLPIPGDGRIPLIAVAVGLVAAAAVLVGAASWSDALITTFGTAIIVCSVVVVSGYGGQLSLCQYALAGFGAWVASRLIATQGISFYQGVLIGVAVTIVAGVVIAVAAVRTRGLNLAIATLALALLFDALIFTNGSLTGGFDGTVVPAPSLFGIDLDPTDHPQRFGALVLVGLVLTALVVANLRRGRVGRRMLAVRSNERAAAALGVSVVGVKLYLFGVGAGIAAFGGILLAFRDTSIAFTSFDVFGSILLVQYAVLGGLGWVSGVVAGAIAAPGALIAEAINRIFPQVSDTSSWLALAGAFGVVALLRQAPDGIAAQWSTAVSGRPALSMLTRSRVPRSTPAPVEAAPRPRPAATLEVEGVTVRFGGITALSDVSLRAAPGDIVGVIGPNGAGKTTLLDVMTGFTRAGSGRVRLDGTDVTRRTPESRARAGMARSWQGVELFEEMTLRDNLLVASDRQRRRHYLTDLVRPGRQGFTASALHLIEEFGLTGVLDERPSALPQGVARLAGIARAIMAEPTVLFLDEPAAGLDGAETEELAAVIRRISQRRGIPIVLVEHDIPLILSTCTHIVVLDFGRQIAAGTPDEIRRNDRVIAAYLGTAVTAATAVTAETAASA